MTALALFLAFGIGLSLGLLGSGGSIVTLPVLVYVAGVPAGPAVGMSLAVVGVTCAAGAWLKHRQGLVHWQSVAWFGLAGMPGALAGARLTSLVSPGVLMLLFATLMALIAFRMLARRGDEAVAPLPDCRPVRCGLAGLGVGLLTGFLGVGGGFLLAPAMMMFARLPVALATGTSLAVIALNSAAGVAGHWAQAGWEGALVLAFLAAALPGMAVGARLGNRLPAPVLRRAFGWFVLAVAGFVFAKNWGALVGQPVSSQP